jgi:hypothetical protein
MNDTVTCLFTSETPGAPADSLQPLREVGSLEKTQHWDREDIIAALRMANLRGIQPESLYARRKFRGNPRAQKMVS